MTDGRLNGSRLVEWPRTSIDLSIAGRDFAMETTSSKAGVDGGLEAAARLSRSKREPNSS